MQTSTDNYFRLAVFCLVFTLYGCNSGSDSEPPKPSLSIADQYMLEPASGSSNYVVTVTLSSASTSAISVDYASGDVSATAGQDYTAISGSLIFAAGETSKTISIPILSDATSESDETLTVSLSNVSGATIKRSSAMVTIVDKIALNDTGITSCGNAIANLLSCPQTLFPGQDAESGLDATQPGSANGKAGFMFTKLDANGNALAASASSWECVRDDVTGLVWEIKSSSTSSIRYKDGTFSWFNADSNTNGGNTGVSTGGSCVGGNCNTAAYVQYVNSNNLCGGSNWRLPTASELISIRDYGASSPPSIDTAYFPDIGASYTYWASDTYASDSKNAVVVTYTTGNSGSSSAEKSTFYAHVRLVR